VRHQHGGLVARQQHILKPRNPVATQRPHPVVLVKAGVAVCALPAALPVRRSAALPAGKNQNIAGIHALNRLFKKETAAVT